MKTKLWLIVSFALLFCVGNFSRHASMSSRPVGDQDFTLINKTGVTIHNLFVSPSAKDEWGEDILGRDTLNDGESVDIKFHPTEQAAHWDLKVTDSSGNALIWTGLNLLEISKVTLYYNDGKATATVE